jgi:multimeric flavodoxin WrbA
MKAVIFNGAPEGHPVLDQADGLLSKELHRHGWEVLSIPLRDLHLSGCKECLNCWLHTPGLCHIRDDARILSRHLVGHDLVALLTPVSFGGYGSLLKTALDRVARPHVLPYLKPLWGEVRHSPRYENRFQILALGSLCKEDPPTEDIFKTVVRRNTLHLAGSHFATEFVYDYMTSKQVDQRVKNLAGKALVPA